MSEFDPYAYSISVRRIEVDREYVFVAKVAELPHVEVLESSAAAALESVADIILGLYEAAIEEGRPFPDPNPISTHTTGRFTLRMPPWLHSALQHRAEAEGQSLNTHICNVLLTHQTAQSVIEAALGSRQTVQATPAEWSADYLVIDAAHAGGYVSAGDLALPRAEGEKTMVRFTTTRPSKTPR